MNNLYATGAEAVSLGSDTTFTRRVCGFKATGAGNVKFKGVDGNDCVFPVLANEYVPVMVLTIYSTANGTTATGVYAFFAP